MPMPEMEDSLEDRYVNFILGVSSFSAVGGKPVPLASFRRTTSEEHVALIQHMRRQLRDFFEACGNFDPLGVLGSGRSGLLLSDALNRAGAVGPISGLHGSKGFSTGVRVPDLGMASIGDEAKVHDDGAAPSPHEQQPAGVLRPPAEAVQ